jgi:hypothetical protein
MGRTDQDMDMIRTYVAFYHGQTFLGANLPDYIPQPQSYLSLHLPVAVLGLPDEVMLQVRDGMRISPITLFVDLPPSLPLVKESVPLKPLFCKGQMLKTFPPKGEGLYPTGWQLII